VDHNCMSGTCPQPSETTHQPLHPLLAFYFRCFGDILNPEVLGSFLVGALAESPARTRWASSF
jgi:hypothetical protein